jgi:hypothetical protein
MSDHLGPYRSPTPPGRPVTPAPKTPVHRLAWAWVRGIHRVLARRRAEHVVLAWVRHPRLRFKLIQQARRYGHDSIDWLRAFRACDLKLPPPPVRVSE